MTLSELLHQVTTIKGVSSAAIVSAEGEMVEHTGASDADAAFIGGLIASSLASSRVLAGLLGEGDVTQTMIEYEQGPVLLMPLGAEDEPVMMTQLASTSALGRARFQLRKLVPDIARAVRT